MKYGHQRKYQRGKVDAGKSMKREMPVSNNFRDLAHHVVADQHANELDLRKFGSVMDDTLLDQVARLSVQSGHCCRVLKLGGSNNITTNGIRMATHTIGGDLDHVDYSHSIMPVEVLKVLGTGLRRLVTLTLVGCPELTTSSLRDIIPSCCETLLHLNLSSCPLVTDETICLISGTLGATTSFQRCKKLKSLNLKNCTKLGSRALAGLGQGCVRLQFLNLEGLSLIDDSGIEKLAKGCRRLKVLHMRYCSKLTDKSLIALGKHCKLLNALNVSGCPCLTTDGLNRVANGCQVLESLNIEGCLLVTEDVLCVIAETCKRIQFLNVNGCQQITESGIATLAYHLPFVQVSTTFRGLQPHSKSVHLKLSAQKKSIMDSAALRIQAWTRGVRGRQISKDWKNLVVFGPAAIIIQKPFRRHLMRRLIDRRIQRKKNIDLKVSKIQAMIRGYLCRLHIRQVEMGQFNSVVRRRAAIKLQARQRGVIARRKYVFVGRSIANSKKFRAEQHLHACAAKLQRSYRKRFARSRFDIVLQVAKLQRKEQMVAASRIQRIWRQHQAQGISMQLKDVIAAEKKLRNRILHYVIRMQSVWRGKQVRLLNEAARLALRSVENNRVLCATKINALARGRLARKNVLAMRLQKTKLAESAFRIQRAWRKSRIPVNKMGKFEGMLVKMKDQMDNEESIAVAKRQEILLRQRRANERDSASESDSDDDWQEFIDESGTSSWFSATRSATSVYRPNVSAHEKSLLGLQVRVFWPMEQCWYDGKITKFIMKKEKHCIEYGDGDHEWLVLRQEVDRLQIYNGYCWCDLSVFCSSESSKKAALFVDLRTQVYYDQVGWLHGTILSFNDVTNEFTVQFDGSSTENLNLYDLDQYVYVQDNRSQEWYTMGEFYFGSNSGYTIQDYLAYTA